MWKVKWSRLADCFCRRPGLVLVLLPCALLASLYLVSEEDYSFDVQYPPFRSYNVVEGTVDGYLVWSPKCHMLSKDPMDSSIARFVKKEKYESCTNDPLYTQLIRLPNGSVVLFVDPAATALHPDLRCCWSNVVRPKSENPSKDNFDSSIVIKKCESFAKQTVLPNDVEVAMVSCKVKAKTRKGRGASERTVYENVHAVVQTEKIKARLESARNASDLEFLSRKLSVLVLGIDSVSRLNFMRSMPRTEKYLRETGWVGLKGYNKMGDNTFPNLMAILTGQSQSQAYARCKPTVVHMLDRCPFIWHNFRNAGYATAYGEDETTLTTFNYLKVGFVDPPTDYYLRPYVLATEKFLKVKKKFGLKYCTGPMSSFDRILDYAGNFARALLGLPYFGFFWTNSVSHHEVNGLSSMDGSLLQKFRQLERQGVLNDTMVVFLSDHGMRWGPLRNTFVGWYEERLPFAYVWLPEWFRAENPEAYRSLRINENRLTSPFDVYETLRDVLKLSGGEADPSPACPSCSSLFAPVPRERGCGDAGVAPHWCTCTAFAPAAADDGIATKGAHRFVEHIEAIVATYRDKRGRRLCAKLRLKKIHRVDRVIDFANSTAIAYFYMIQVTPGDAKFEVTVRYHGDGNYTLSDDEVSRINPYASNSGCLERGKKQYCHCLR